MKFSYQLGIALNLPKEVVERIHAEHKKPLDRLRHIIEAFLTGSQSQPTWRAVVQALQTPGFNQPQLAKDIERKFCTPVHATTGLYAFKQCVYT